MLSIESVLVRNMKAHKRQYRSAISRGFDLYLFPATVISFEQFGGKNPDRMGLSLMADAALRWLMSSGLEADPSPKGRCRVAAVDISDQVRVVTHGQCRVALIDVSSQGRAVPHGRCRVATVDVSKARGGRIAHAINQPWFPQMSKEVELKDDQVVMEAMKLSNQHQMTHNQERPHRSLQNGRRPWSVAGKVNKASCCLA